MRRKNTLQMAMLTVILAGALIVVRSSASGSLNSTKESLDQCCKKKNAEPDRSGWEDLSHRFFSSI